MGILQAACLPLASLNHVSFVCKNVCESAQFYQNVLGFVLIRRPSSFRFEGAWLFNYGIGIHLLEAAATEQVDKKKPTAINPKDNHISFQCTDIELVKTRLAEMGIKYVSGVVEEEGIYVDQLFFHDPDGYMIEICNCENLPLLPRTAACACACACPLKNPQSCNKIKNRSCVETSTNVRASNMEACMMENLVINLINITM